MMLITSLQLSVERERLTVVLSTSSNTLLRVDSPDQLGEIRLGVGGTEEEGFVLVHTLIVSCQVACNERAPVNLQRWRRGGYHRQME
jgi:hypothetical protein